MAALFPMFVKLDGRRVCCGRRGSIAGQKLESLLESGADVQIVAPRCKRGDSGTCAKRPRLVDASGVRGRAS